MAFIDIDVTKNIKTIDCWMQGEKNAEGVHFDISTWIETYGAGTAYIYIRRNGDETAYFRAMEVTDEVAEWLFSAADTAKAGDGRAQAVYITTDESVVKKTNWYHTVTAESEGDPTGEDPDPYKEMATEVIARMEEAEEELTEEALGEISDAKDAALEDIQDTMFNLAPEFVTTASYSAGDIVLYIGNLYEFTADHAAGAWIGTDARQTTIGGVVADLKEEINDKPNWTVGSAEQIVSDEASATNVTPYTFRRSGGGLIPFNFTREELSKVVGGTVAWNQLAKVTSAITNNFTQTYIYYGVIGNLDSPVKIIADHVYLYSVTADISIAENAKCSIRFAEANGTLRVTFEDNGLTGHSKGTLMSISKPSTGLTSSELYYNNYVGKQGVASGDSISVQKVIITDLTALFSNPAIADYVYSLEQATAGEGVAWLKTNFPKLFDTYKAYDPGSLQSVCVGAHECVGFNAWDEEWENGQYVVATGEKATGSNQIRSKNKIPIFPNTQYYFQFSSGTMNGVFFYDADENYLGASAAIGISSPAVKTTPNNAYYMTFQMNDAYGTTYKNDITINLSKPTGTPKNGDYVPYVKHTYTLDSTKTLRGRFYLDSNNQLRADGDVYPPSGEVGRRYAIVDLGTLTYTYSPSTGVFLTNIDPNRHTDKVYGNLVCSMYVMADNNDYTSWPNLSIRNTNSQDNPILRIKNTAYTDPATFKTAMNGVYLVYELATPTTETADPYTAVQICDSDGTEEFVDALVASGDRDVAIPAGTETVYYEDMAGKLAGLPPIPSAPSANGTYTLQAVVSSGTVTYQWQS